MNAENIEALKKLFARNHVNDREVSTEECERYML